MRQTGLWDSMRMGVLLAMLSAAIAQVRAAEPAETAGAIRKAAGTTGGLIVHVGCNDGRLTAALYGGKGFVVHGLDVDAADVARARAHVRSRGLYGPVSVERWGGGRLPYADNLVNLLVVAEGVSIPRREMMRVLVPGGTLRAWTDGRWTNTVKPRPRTLGESGHYLGGPDNNAVTPDTEVGPPRKLQWTAGPTYSRNHEYMSSVSAVVSAGGRVFHVIDEGPTVSILLPARWFLTARDAFNGIELWRKPLASWQDHSWSAKSGPVQIARRLATDGKYVYVPLGARAGLSVLDAATGRELATCAETAPAEEILCTPEAVLVLVGPSGPTAATAAARRRMRDDSSARRLVAVRPGSGEVLWRLKPSPILPLTPAAAAGRVFYHDSENLVCLDLKTARRIWRVKLPCKAQMPYHHAPTLVVSDNVVLLASDKALTARRADDGRELWSAPAAPPQYRAPSDVFVIGGLVWTTDVMNIGRSGRLTGRDLRTGKVRKTIETGKRPAYGMPHHRCHRAKAAGPYVLTSRAGVEFVDTRDGSVRRHHWVRGACLYGILACNGLLYAPPHPCGCFIKAKLTGFNALAPGRAEAPATGPRIEKGPAYAPIGNGKSKPPDPTDWPTHRHDTGRSGLTGVAVNAAALKPAWTRTLGGRLSGITVAAGKAFVAAVDRNTVYALGAPDGKTAWTFTAGGRVDSPPTLAAGRVVFGSADGWVYCLRAADGRLAWRFRGAPGVRRIMARGRLESAWPVHGSVLVVGPGRSAGGTREIVFAAGRSSFLDGGIRLCRLDLATGKLLGETVVYDADPKTGRHGPPKGFAMQGALSDVLSFQGGRIWMRHRGFDTQLKEVRAAAPHLFSSAGLLDDAWWHRTYWQYGREMESGFLAWRYAFSKAPSGRILSCDTSSVYGFGRINPYPVGTRVQRGEAHHLFRASKKLKEQGDPGTGIRRGRLVFAPPSRVDHQWSRRVGLQGRALVVTKEAVLVAGCVGAGTESADEYYGRRGAKLLVVARADGKTVAEHALGASPVFDGMAVADGCVFLATVDGKVICLVGPR